MIDRFLVEVIHDPDAVRATCLKCGMQVRPPPAFYDVTTRTMYEHKCDQISVFGAFPHKHDHWREVVRDAFLNGRDAEAIEIICHELKLVPP